jgi:hypothetical protein
MMQETNIAVPANFPHGDEFPGQSLVALLALAGTKPMNVETLRGRVKLSPFAFGNLLDVLQREYLVDLVSTLEGERIEERVALTDKGESLLVSILEQTCELPEFR